MRGAHVLSGVIAFGASVTIFMRQPALDSMPRGHSRAASSETPMGLEHTSDPARSADWHLLTETEGLDARARAIGGDWSWLETAAELGDPFFVAAERRKCDASYGSAIAGRCWYTLSYVVEAVEPGIGRIVYSRASLRDRDNLPPAEAPNDPGCESYVGCLAHARLEVAIPLPIEGSSSYIAIEEHMQSTWGDPILFDLQRLPDLIDFWAQDRRHWAAKEARGEIADVDSTLKLRFIESLVPYLRQHEERLQEASQ